MGFHYPRDIETAIQSVQGYKEFREHFFAACEFSFPCYYGLSNIGSKTNFDSYMLFMKQVNLKHEQVSVAEMVNYGFNLDNVSHLWKCDEGVVDNEVLRTLIIENLRKYKVNVSVEDQVMDIRKERDYWHVNSRKNSTNFDVVIKATYGLDDIHTKGLIKDIDKSMLQATLVIECKLPVEKFGLTVVDGDFITVLPKGFTDKFLVYAPGPSIMAQSKNLDVVLEASRSEEIIEKATCELVKRFNYYFPDIELETITNRMITIRNLDAGTMKTDKRISKIENISPNYYEIRSGKIDHSILIAKKFCEYLA